VATLLMAGCGGSEVVVLQETTTPSNQTQVGRAPAYALSPDGAESVLWVSAPEGGTHGRLQLLRGSQLLEIGDSLGVVEAHDEAPPKIAYGSDSSSLYILYVVSRDEGKRFPTSALRFIASSDGGASWSAPVTVTDDSEFGSHNFHALHVARDGVVYVSWLDGRNGVSNVYVARSGDRGRTWERNRRVYEGEACPCCRTNMASDSKGNLFLAWRTVMEGDIRDIVVSRSADGGASWTDPARVNADNWVFPGCPHAGPDMKVDDQDRLHIAWWTGLPGKAGVYYAHSDDAALSWSEPQAMGVAEYSRPASVQLALSKPGRVLVVWSDGTLEVPSVVMKVSRNRGGHFGERIQLSDPARHAFFPVLGVRDSLFTVLWSEQSPQYAIQETASHPDMKNPEAKKGLSAVGNTSVALRRGILR
jgi:hypothetical protein